MLRPVGAAIGFSLPFVFLSFKRTRRLRAFEEQFPDGLDLIPRVEGRPRLHGD